MSKDKLGNSWDNLIAESALPADEFTWTDGSNYGMDGYHHTQTMGEGLNHKSLPGSSPGGVRDTTIGMQTVGDIPDDMFSDPTDNLSFIDEDPLHIIEDGFNLDDMLSDSEIPMSHADRQAASLSNLDWLDPTQKQDPERLPQVPNSVPELVEAWGVERRTDGIKLIPNKDRETEAYNQKLRSPPPALPGARAASDAFIPAVQRAVRRSHFGHPLMEIAQELVDTLGDTDPRLKVVMARIAADHGLAGTVFVNASVFPGIKNGKWVSKLKRQARSAAFVLTDDDVVATKLGLQKAGGLHWGKVLDFYRPRLAAAGYKLAALGDPKEILRTAFLSGPEAKLAASNHKPVDVRPADTVSTMDAFRLMSRQGKSEVEVVASLEGRALENKRAALRTEIQKWHRAGKLTQQEAMRLATSTADLADVRKCLANLVLATEAHTYNASTQYTPKDVHVLRRKAFESLASKELELEAGLKKKFALEMVKQVKAGLLTKDEAQKILGYDKPVAELQRIATMVVQQAGQSRRTKMAAVETADYKGHVFRAAEQKSPAMQRLSAQQQTVIAHSESTGVPASEFFALLKFATREMNEGMQGRDLNQMLNVRFTPNLLRAAAPLLTVLREAHEGLAGHVYLDASAYATPSGVNGCEKGALKHRSNQIKTVLAMPRCSGCVHASEGICSLYNKPLIESASEVLGDVKAAQKRLLHYADATDAEIIGSLFNPMEFNLVSATDNIDLSEMGSVSQLEGIMFGGLDFGED